MKRDWNADELAEHWTLLPSEKPCSATRPERHAWALPSC